MLVEFVQFLQNNLRPALLDTRIGTHLFHPKENNYFPLKYENRSRSVSSLESFIDTIIEEAKRRGNKTGEFMTVVLNGEGGRFFPDDKDRIQTDEWTYARCYSAAYEAFRNGIGKPMNHINFLRYLQGMKPSIEEFPEIFKAFRKVQLDTSSMMASSPILENGTAGREYSFQLKAANGTSKVVLPAEIQFHMQVVKASGCVHSFKAETDVSLARDGKEIVFFLIFPGFEILTEEILMEEKKKVEAAIQPILPDCFIVVDY